MHITKQIALHMHQVFFGGNWTSVSFHKALADVTFETAIAKPYERVNSIVELLYHVTYYPMVVLQKLNGGTFDAHDKFSFDAPQITDQLQWQQFIKDRLSIVESFCLAITALNDECLNAFFVEEKYGSYYRNLQGIIEHSHYHLGQIVLLKKLIS